MKIPGFTADASLYRTNGHYLAGRNRHAIHLPARMIETIRPARDEVIEVHSCPPGWTDIGGTCWPNPLTEPSSSGSAGGGMPGSGGGGSGGGASGGLGDYWVCKSGCETAHSKCLDTCEGTWENPKPSRNCLICDENYQRCLNACSRNIA
jgi:hypothetical protein